MHACCLLTLVLFPEFSCDVSLDECSFSNATITNQNQLHMQ